MKRTPLRRYKTTKRTKKRKTRLARAKMNPRSPYWKRRADELFMAQYRGQPCAICGKTEGTAGHHIILKSCNSTLRLSPENIIVLCPIHHKWSRDMAPHSMNPFAVLAFMNWLQANRPEQWEWCLLHKHDRIITDYAAWVVEHSRGQG